jgi:hypothetical protein
VCQCVLLFIFFSSGIQMSVLLSGIYQATGLGDLQSDSHRGTDGWSVLVAIQKRNSPVALETREDFLE